MSAYAASRIHPTIEAEDTGIAALRFANGAFGTILGSTAMFPGQPPKIEIGGENGLAISENGLKFFKFRDERPGDQALLENLSPPATEAIKRKVQQLGGEELLEKLGMKKASSTGGGASNTDVGLDLHSKNILAILAAWDEGRDAETSGDEARKSVAIVLAMYESARRGGAPVDVK